MNTTNRLKYWLPLIVALSVVCGILIGFKITGVKKYTPAQAKLAQLIGIIQEQYVDDIDIDSLIERTIPDLIHNLDPHSAYIAPEDLQAANSELESTFGGIGIQLQMVGDTIHVIEVITGGPSEKVGLMPGDRIIKVDSTSITGSNQNIDKILKLIRGEKGTSVRLTVKRSTSSKPLTFDITRDDIPQTSIDAAYMADKRTGYVKVSKFARNTYAEFLQAVNKLRVNGAERYVIDLRGNTGGFMETAIMMVNEFLPPMRRIVETRGRDTDKDSNVISDGTGTFADAELVVLIDEFSASASEIFAGAIQDNDRGLVIGRRSFGKGLVQLPIMLADSSMVRLTVQRYYTPSGRCIQKTYKPGENDDYETEILERYNRGEVFSADSVKFNTDETYHTLGGRTVYGGGGIMPDVFVPNDTTGVTKYYINLTNHGAIQKFAYEYADLNRADLSKASDIEQLLRKLPPDNILINSLVYYASTQLKVSLRPLQLDISRKLILSQIKAFIIRDILGIDAFYEFYNRSDTAVAEALRQLERGKAAVPIGAEATTEP